MSKWCANCYRNDVYGEYKPCGKDCPVFGKNFEVACKEIIDYLLVIEYLLDWIEDEHMGARKEAIKCVREKFNVDL